MERKETEGRDREGRNGEREREKGWRGKRQREGTEGGRDGERKRTCQHH